MDYFKLGDDKERSASTIKCTLLVAVNTEKWPKLLNLSASVHMMRRTGNLSSIHLLNQCEFCLIL